MGWYVASMQLACALSGSKTHTHTLNGLVLSGVFLVGDSGVFQHAASQCSQSVQVVYTVMTCEMIPQTHSA